VAKKDFLTVAKITRSDQIIRDFAFTLMARFDAPLGRRGVDGKKRQEDEAASTTDCAAYARER
jgi:hypothetical protein